MALAVIALLEVLAARLPKRRGAVSHLTPTHCAGSPFFSLVAPEAMAAQRSAVLVASQVSGAALADYGLPLDPARVDEPIAAEFLLSPAGVVLAVRFTE